MSDPVQQWKKANPDRYDALIAASGGRCVLCLKKFNGRRRPALDHVHETGLVRGVPCAACNQRIGFDHEDVGWWRRAADYVEEPPAIYIIGFSYIPGSMGAAGL